MKTRLAKLYSGINEVHPSMGALARRLYHRKLFNSVRRVIRGKDNLITYKGAILTSVVFDIQGNGNKISSKGKLHLE